MCPLSRRTARTTGTPGGTCPRPTGRLAARARTAAWRLTARACEALASNRCLGEKTAILRNDMKPKGPKLQRANWSLASQTSVAIRSPGLVFQHICESAPWRSCFFKGPPQTDNRLMTCNLVSCPSGEAGSGSGRKEMKHHQ